MTTKLDGLYTPGGRLVMGSLTQKQDKDFDGKPIALENQRYFFGLAVPKDAPGVVEIINSLWQMAATDYANVPLVMAQINKGLDARDFAWKIDDGDAQRFDKKTGQPRPTPDYVKGCYIFKFSTQFEIGACDVNGVELNRADIKIGDYADVMFNSQVNGKNDDTAGIYLNPVAIRRLGFGEPISTSISASAAFAGRAATVPVGATRMPTGAGAVPPAGMPMGNPVAPAVAPMAPAMPPAAGGMPGAPTPTAFPGSYPQILQGPPAGGMPGMNR